MNKQIYPEKENEENNNDNDNNNKSDISNNRIINKIKSKKYLEINNNEEDSDENELEINKNLNGWINPSNNSNNDNNNNHNKEKNKEDVNEKNSKHEHSNKHHHHHHRHHRHHHHHSSNSSSNHKNDHDKKSSSRNHHKDHEDDGSNSSNDKSDRNQNDTDILPTTNQSEEVWVKETPVIDLTKGDIESNIENPVSPSKSQIPPPAPLLHHGERTKSYVETVDIFFRHVKSDVDSLSQYMPIKEQDPVLESITEILFKDYPLPLKAFAYLLWFCQFITLLALFWSMLPCPKQKVDWSVVIGLPLCCGYGGIESVHELLRFIHLARRYPILVFMIKLNALFQLLCVGVVMGKSVGLLDLISNFIGVAIVLQVDELLASYIKIKDIEPKLVSETSWKTKMLLSSKLALVVFFGILVYLVTLAVWYTDKWTCWNKNGSHSS